MLICLAKVVYTVLYLSLYKFYLPLNMFLKCISFDISAVISLLLPLVFHSYKWIFKIYLPFFPVNINLIRVYFMHLWIMLQLMAMYMSPSVWEIYSGRVESLSVGLMGLQLCNLLTNYSLEHYLNVPPSQCACERGLYSTFGSCKKNVLPK